ncbi:hypothetical protein GCM10009860_16870 [Microbacterium mitrae]
MFRLGLRHPRRLLGDIEKLSEGHVSPHASVLGAHQGRVQMARDGFFEKVIAPCDQEIAEQNGAGDTEIFTASAPASVAVSDFQCAVSGGAPPPGIGMVDEIVMHESRGLKNLQRARDRYRFFCVRLATRGDPTGVAKLGTKPLATGQSHGRGIE